jgi:mono/diheme cytochrome c family protein
MTMSRMKQIVMAGVTLALATPMLVEAQDKGADTFKWQCAMCHGSDGSGNTGMGKSMGVKPLNSPEVQKMSDANLKNLISNGKGKMPAYKGKLRDDEIQAVIKFITTFDSSK